MKKLLLLMILTLVSASQSYAGELKPFSINRTETVGIQDRHMSRQYELYVKLPEGYAQNPEKRYPVIYFTDADWHMEILSASTTFIMEEVILVGVSWQTDLGHEDAHFSRYRDYSMSQSDNPDHQAKYQFGQADHHLRFIRHDVIPYVEAQYRTDSSNRTYFGYSMGGSFGAYILMSAPDTFQHYIVGSPALRRLSKRIAKGDFKDSKLDANVYLSSGTEGDELSRGEHIETFLALLNTPNHSALTVIHDVVEGSHSSAFPMTGVRSMKGCASRLAAE